MSTFSTMPNFQYSEPIPKPYHEESIIVDTNEVSGQYASLECKCTDFSPYEIRNFIEEKMQIGVEDLSLARDYSSAFIGYILVKFQIPITFSQISIIHGQSFKGFPVKATLYRTASEFNRFIAALAQKKAQSIVLPPKSGAPLVYIYDFDGFVEELEDLLKSAIQEEPEIQTKSNEFITYFIVTYKSINSALTACKLFEGFHYKDGIMKVRPLFRLASERVFSVEGTENAPRIVELAKMFGTVTMLKVAQNKALYVLMESVDGSRAACTYLNHMIVDDHEIITHFIDFDRFSSA